MYSYKPLVGSEARSHKTTDLGGFMDTITDAFNSAEAKVVGVFQSAPDIFNLKQQWNTIKYRINDLQNLGAQISAQQQKLGIVYSNLLKKGMNSQAVLIKQEGDKTNEDMANWWKIKGYLDTYLPEFMKLDQGQVVGPSAVSGLGILPMVLGVAAIAALAYIATTGMALLQDYAFKSKLTAAVIEGKMTSGQEAEVLSVPSEKGVLQEVVGKVGLGVGIGLPTILLVGGGLYFLFATGMLKNILGSIGGSSSSSSQAS